MRCSLWGYLFCCARLQVQNYEIYLSCLTQHVDNRRWCKQYYKLLSSFFTRNFLTLNFPPSKQWIDKKSLSCTVFPICLGLCMQIAKSQSDLILLNLKFQYEILAMQMWDNSMGSCVLSGNFSLVRIHSIQSSLLVRAVRYTKIHQPSRLRTPKIS